jgi:hypothetical protein
MRSRRRGRRGRARHRRWQLLGLAVALAAVGTWAVREACKPGPWQRVFATREGLTGQRLACGQINQAGSLFVALPHPSALRRDVELRYGGRVLVVPVLDVGPWNVADPYWESTRRPAAERGQGTYRRPTNPAGIDLSDAVFAGLGMRNNDVVEWRFVHRGYIPLPRVSIAAGLGAVSPSPEPR